MNRRFAQLFIALLICFVFPIITHASKDKFIEIGALYNLSGDQAVLDKASLRGARVAIAAINKKGGVKGYELRLQLQNGKGNPKILKRKAESLSRMKNVQIVMGLSDNNMVMIAAPTIAKAKKIFITSGATSPRLMRQISRYLYLISFGDNTQAAAAAEFAFNYLKIRSAVLLYDENMEYTKGLASYFVDAFVRDGGTLSLVKSFPHDHFDNSIIKRLKSHTGAMPLIYLAASADEAPKIIHQLRNNGIHSVILGGDTYIANSIIPAKKVYFTSHAFLNANSQDSAMRNFIQRFREKFHVMPHNAFSALGYDTINFIAYTLSNANDFTAAAFINAIAKEKSFKGITGTINYHLSHAMKKVSIIKIDGDHTKLVTEMIPKYIPKPLS